MRNSALRKISVVWCLICGVTGQFLLGQGYQEQLEQFQKGDSLFKAQDYEEAIAVYEGVYQRGEGCWECDSLNVRSLLKKARAHVKRGEVDLSEAANEKAAVLAEEIELPILATRARINQGFDLSRKGEIKRAELVIRAALAERKKIYGEYSYEYARALSNLESITTLQGKYGESEAYLEQAEKIFSEVRRQAGTEKERLRIEKRVGIGLVNRAGLLVRRMKEDSLAAEVEGLASKADYFLVHAQILFEALEIWSDYANYVYETRAELAREMDDFGLAEEAFASADSVYMSRNGTFRDHGRMLLTWGEMQLEAREYKEAEKTFVRALEQMDPAFSPANEEAYLQEKKISRDDPNLFAIYEGIARALTLDGAAQKMGARHDRALSYIDLAFDLGDTLGRAFQDPGDRIFLAEKVWDLRSSALRIALSEDPLKPMSEKFLPIRSYLEKTRSIVLKLELQDLLAEWQMSSDQWIFQVESNLQTRIAQARVLLEVPGANRDSLEGLIYDWDQERATLRDRHVPALANPWEERESNLAAHLREEKALLVEYFQLEQQWHALAFDGSLTDLYKIGDVNLADSVQAYVDLISTPRKDRRVSFDALLQTGGQLYNDLIAPVLKDRDMDRIEKLVLLPEGDLSFLPFECLISQGGLREDDREVRYLVQDQVVSYAWSRSMIEALRSPNREPGQVLALGRDFAGEEGKSRSAFGNEEQLSALPFVEQEIEAVLGQVGGERWFGPEAGEGRFKRDQGAWRVIHFSTHGKADLESPNLSRLYLFPDSADHKGNVEDGKLHLFEIPREIGAELVVMSACETAKGELARGEGVMSLARAFARSGCPATISSLWNVKDEVGPAVMEDFYRELAGGKSSAEALAEAKRNMIAKGSDPFEWGPFVLQGADEPIRLERGGGIPWWGWLAGGIGLILAGFLLFRRKVPLGKATIL